MDRSKPKTHRNQLPRWDYPTRQLGGPNDLDGSNVPDNINMHDEPDGLGKPDNHGNSSGPDDMNRTGRLDDKPSWTGPMTLMGLTT